MYWYDDEVESSTIGLVQWHWLIDIEIEMTKVRWMTNTQTQTQRGSTRVKVEGFLNSDPSIILPIKKYYSLTFHNYYSLFHLASHISLFSSNSARPGTCITRSLGLVGLAACHGVPNGPCWWVEFLWPHVVCLGFGLGDLTPLICGTYSLGRWRVVEGTCSCLGKKMKELRRCELLVGEEGELKRE